VRQTTPWASCLSGKVAERRFK